MIKARTKMIKARTKMIKARLKMIKTSIKIKIIEEIGQTRRLKREYDTIFLIFSLGWFRS